MNTQTSVRRLLDGAGTDRQAHLDRHGPLPHLSLDALLAAVEAGGLTGRGGAGFPTAIKVRAVASAGRRPVVVGNAMEGEPLSHKDAVLVARNPQLVLDGLEVLGRALHAKRVVLAVGPEIDPSPARAAARHRKVEIVHLGGGFIAGQETALVNQLDGRPALPRDPFTRVTESGVDGRPTLVINAETLGPGRPARPARGRLVPHRRHSRRPRHLAVHRHRLGPAPRCRRGRPWHPAGRGARRRRSRSTRSRSSSVATTAPGCRPPTSASG